MLRLGSRGSVPSRSMPTRGRDLGSHSAFGPVARAARSAPSRHPRATRAKDAHMDEPARGCSISL